MFLQNNVLLFKVAVRFYYYVVYIKIYPNSGDITSLVLKSGPFLDEFYLLSSILEPRKDHKRKTNEIS